MKYAIIAALLCAAPVPAVAHQTVEPYELSVEESAEVCRDAWGPESLTQYDTESMDSDSRANLMGVLLLNAMHKHHVTSSSYESFQVICRFYLHGVGDMVDATIRRMGPEVAHVDALPLVQPTP
jgi:hypothetical protein